MGPRHVRGDGGGVWIKTGWAVGCVVYAGVVLAWHAGFTAATPFVVIPPVLLLMIGAGNWISGKRGGRSAPRFNRPDPVPLSSLRGGPDGPRPEGGTDGSPSLGTGPDR
jgi:hypothetical protein